ncbi:MAG: hypothetical protein WBD31_01050 [Rubripirellula sp.]
MSQADDEEYFDFMQGMDEWRYLKFPCECMRQCGSATQTMGAVLHFTDKDTFVTTQAIADAAQLPLRTTKRHLDKLAQCGWMTNEGRSKTRAGWTRRTATRTVTKAARKELGEYTVYPRWMECFAEWSEPLSWSSKALFSVILSRVRGIQTGDDTEDFDTLEDLIVKHDSRFAFSFASIHEKTGLHSEAVVNAKRQLSRVGAIEWSQGMGVDMLTPTTGILIRQATIDGKRIHEFVRA